MFTLGGRNAVGSGHTARQGRSQTPVYQGRSNCRGCNDGRHSPLCMELWRHEHQL